jgi:hypothetical protein
MGEDHTGSIGAALVFAQHVDEGEGAQDVTVDDEEGVGGGVRVTESGDYMVVIVCDSARRAEVGWLTAVNDRHTEFV